jgi:drug/metabolite transporter (DMT)-like permease
LRQFYLHPSIWAALGSALLFGASVPFAKQLLGNTSPLLLAGILYLGSGVGLLLFRLIKNKGWEPIHLFKREWFWLMGAILFGGVLAPTLLMIGLMQTSAATTSLLLNLESVLTAILAWIFFKENTDRRIVAGMFFIVAGGVVLSLGEKLSAQHWLGVASIGAACLCWAIDNNLTRKVSISDSVFIAGSKGLVAGITNVSLALILGFSLPAFSILAGGLLLGFLGYGISLVLFVLALRGLGAARTGAYFSTAPFIGATIAILFFHNPVSSLFWISAVLMSVGVWIHFAEQHIHLHTHEPLWHTHQHTHDEHHNHQHSFPCDLKKPHTHPHQHEQQTHSHSHYPDTHHRHLHD